MLVQEIVRFKTLIMTYRYHHGVGGLVHFEVDPCCSRVHDSDFLSRQ